MIDSSGVASGSCLISTTTELFDSFMRGGRRRIRFMASTAVLSPSPTSLFGGLGDLLIRRTSAPFLANCSSKMFLTVMWPGSSPGLSTSTLCPELHTRHPDQGFWTASSSNRVGAARVRGFEEHGSRALFRAARPDYAERDQLFPPCSGSRVAITVCAQPHRDTDPASQASL